MWQIYFSVLSDLILLTDSDHSFFTSYETEVFLRNRSMDLSWMFDRKMYFQSSLTARFSHVTNIKGGNVVWDV